MADKTWKRVEREKCRQLGGERSGPTGRDMPDCDEKVHVALEVKAYKTFVFLTKDWEQAVENAEKVGKIPVLNVRESGRGGRDYVQMRDREFGNLWLTSGLPPIRLTHHTRGLVRLSWNDFVRLYHAAYNTKEISGCK